MPLPTPKKLQIVIKHLPDQTDAGSAADRARLIAEGVLTPYVDDPADYGFDRPAMTQDQVDTLRSRLITGGCLVVADTTYMRFDPKTGRKQFYKDYVSLVAPLPIANDEANYEFES